MSTSNDARLPTLSTLFNILPRVSPKTLDEQQILDDEWRNFPMIATQTKDIQDATEKVDVFWHKISELKDIDGNKKFMELPKFMLGVLSLPHSNAECERIFSQVNDIKTKKKEQTFNQNN
ncbi:unnamed protein product [Euphydryas editha]|uniref:HAT C-terminal dimerisation domain-containing protein n=1 Tax=Euphydryas editha TaxID=104508 RepID=A0AAU9UAJ1_EUPED|nr:unnamed protein product [Euphydryas editha]